MSKLKVMIVEDITITSMALETMLLKEGYEVVGEATSGEKAIQLFREKEPHLVLLDVELEGEMSGIDVGRVITSERAVPIIYLTGYPHKFDEAKVTHPVAFLTKPYDEASLSRAVELALLNFRPSIETQESGKAQFPNLFFARNCVWVKQGAGKPFVKVPFDTIRHVLADNVYLEIETSDELHPRHCIVFKISDFADHVQDVNFVRVHVSHLVNLNWIKSFSKQEGIFLKGSKLNPRKNNKENELPSGEGNENPRKNSNENEPRPDGYSRPIPISKTYFENFMKSVQG